MRMQCHPLIPTTVPKAETKKRESKALLLKERNSKNRLDFRNTHGVIPALSDLYVNS
jgi:hypothetical protein